MFKRILVLIFILWAANYLTAQTDTDDNGEFADSIDYSMKPKFGIFFHYGLNLHAAGFTDLPGINVCCPNYSSGFGTGFSFGGLYEYLYSKELRIGGRIGFNQYGGTLTTQETKNIIVDGKSQDGVIEYSIESKHSTLGLEPIVSYSFEPNFWATFGLRFGFLMNSDHYQKEEIKQPSDRGKFNDGARYHDLSYGELPSAAGFEFGFNIGASYESPLNKDSSLIISPEIFYGYNFTPVVSGLSWNVHNIRLGVAIKYRESQPPPPPPPPPLPPIFPKPYLPEQPPAIAASVQIYRVDSTGKEEKNFNIKIEDFISLNMRPLLNYIFFDENSSEIPKRYIKIDKEKISNFSVKTLQNLGALETYYQVLNIIGYRMRLYPEATIEIVGCNSNINDEKGNMELSRSRASAIRDYLRDVWEIDGTRMPIKARNLPDKESRNDEPGGDEENRRVEILTDDLRINEPVTTIDTLRSVNQYNLRFRNNWKTEVGIKNWELKAEFDNHTLFEKNGINYPDSTIDWTLNGNNGNKPKTAGSIFYYLRVTDSLGQTAVSQKNRLPIEQLTIDRKRLERIEDKEFEYYSLILFDFGKSDLRGEHKKVVDLIKDRITSSSSVVIKGFTDSMGDEDINKKISDKRAKAVASRLKIPVTSVEGIGETSLLYPNDTPEGRFYCRTVQIIIETPVIE